MEVAEFGVLLPAASIKLLSGLEEGPCGPISGNGVFGPRGCIK